MRHERRRSRPDREEKLPAVHHARHTGCRTPAEVPEDAALDDCSAYISRPESVHAETHPTLPEPHVQQRYIPRQRPQRRAARALLRGESFIHRTGEQRRGGKAQGAVGLDVVKQASAGQALGLRDSAAPILSGGWRQRRPGQDVLGVGQPRPFVEFAERTHPTERRCVSGGPLAAGTSM
jgi:hypothetical protein